MSRYPYRYGYGWGGRRGGGAVFDETSLFDVDGAFFDADDPATLYQDSTGSTLVSATGQQVGFQGDKSQGFALGAELIPADLSTVFADRAEITASSGSINFNTTVPDQIAASGFTTVGNYYKIRFEIYDYVSGSINFRFGSGGQNDATNLRSGYHEFILFDEGGSIAFRAGEDTTQLKIRNTSVRELPRNHATQSGSSFRPFFRETSSVGYLDYDALDDRLVGTAVCGSSGNSIAVKTTIPASVASTQVIMGLSGASTDRFFVGVNTSGFLCAGVGTDSVGTIVGDTDIRGETGVIFLVEDGDDVFLYWNDTLAYTAARNGAPSTTQPFFYGALNANGTASSFYGGDIWKSINLQRALTATERANILTKWS